MESLVEYKYKEPTVSTRRIAEEFEQRHTYLMELLESHKSKLEVFGVVRFETYKPKTGRPQKIAELTEPQILLLLTYTRSRKRTDELRIKLISDFMLMKKFIMDKQISRSIGIETRKTLTDAIDESGENERMHGRGYSNFTRLVYQVTGLYAKYKTFTSLKKTWKDQYKDKTFRDELNPRELKRVELAESLIKPMLKLEKEYSDIKECLEPLFKVKEIG